MTEITPTRKSARLIIWIIAAAIVILGTAGLAFAVIYASHSSTSESPKDKLLAPYLAKEQHADDLAWLLLQDSARRHLAAVRTGAAERPDNQLAHDIAVYAGVGKGFFRKGLPDPTSKLADLREAMDDLRPLNAKRIDCKDQDLASSRQKECAAYYDALVALFGRDL